MNEKEALWRERISAWKASGQSLRSFALMRGWRPRQMGYWKKRLEQAAVAVPMIPVEVKRASAAPMPITLRSPSGWTVQLAGEMSAVWLAELLRTL